MAGFPPSNDVNNSGSEETEAKGIQKIVPRVRK